MYLSSSFINEMWREVVTPAAEGILTPALRPTPEALIAGLESLDIYKETTKRDGLPTATNIRIQSIGDIHNRVFNGECDILLPEPIIYPINLDMYLSRVAFNYNELRYSFLRASNNTITLDASVQQNLHRQIMERNRENNTLRQLFCWEFGERTTLKQAIDRYPSLARLNVVQERLATEKQQREDAKLRRKNKPGDYTPQERISLATQNAIAKARLLSSL